MSDISTILLSISWSEQIDQQNITFFLSCVLLFLYLFLIFSFINNQIHSLNLWYRRFYGSVYSHAILINFVQCPYFDSYDIFACHSELCDVITQIFQPIASVTTAMSINQKNGAIMLI
jgi:hypothetical protein